MFEELLKCAVQKGASDIHITAGAPPRARINGDLVPIGSEKLDAADTEAIVKEVLGKEHLEEYRLKGETDLSYSVKGLGRFRISVYRQRGSSSMALRVVALRIPTMEELGLPESVGELARITWGLVLVTGPDGSCN